VKQQPISQGHGPAALSRRADIARHIELRYDPKRFHSAPGYRAAHEAMEGHREMRSTA
jgi:hypothetical protein